MVIYTDDVTRGRYQHGGRVGGPGKQWSPSCWFVEFNFNFFFFALSFPNRGVVHRAPYTFTQAYANIDTNTPNGDSVRRRYHTGQPGGISWVVDRGAEGRANRALPLAR